MKFCTVRARRISRRFLQRRYGDRLPARLLKPMEEEEDLEAALFLSTDPEDG